MRHFLPHLNQSFPCVLCGQFGAVRTLSMLDEVFDLEDLLEDGRSENLNSARRYKWSEPKAVTRGPTSFCMVNFTLMRFEWGSVQINPASTKRTLLSPLSFFKQMASSSRLSGCAMVHCAGGDRNRSQFRQKDTEPVKHAGRSAGSANRGVRTDFAWGYPP